MSTKLIPLNLIIPDPEQPRKAFITSEMKELKNSIESQGILTPLIVESNYKDNKYLLLDGERRYRCAKELQLEKVPTEIIKGPLTYEERTTIRFHIQEQHSSWTELDKARAIYKYRKETNKTIAEIAQTLNLQIPKVHGYLSVTEFTKTGQALIVENDIEFTYLIFLIRAVKQYLVFYNKKQEYIEEKLIEKIKTNIFKTVSNIQLFSKLMNNDGYEKLKIKFLEETDMSLKDFTKDSKINQKEEIDKLYKSLARFDYYIADIIEKEYIIPNEHKKLLETIYKRINTIL